MQHALWVQVNRHFYMFVRVNVIFPTCSDGCSGLCDRGSYCSDSCCDHCHLQEGGQTNQALTNVSDLLVRSWLALYTVTHFSGATEFDSESGLGSTSLPAHHMPVSNLCACSIFIEISHLLE